MRTNRLAAALLPLALLAAAGLAGCNFSANFVGTQQLFVGAKTSGAAASATAAQSTPATIKVTTSNGSITVRPAMADPAAGSAAGVSISAEIRAVTQERLDACKIVTETDATGTLSISVLWPGSGREPNEGASITVLTPEVRGTILRTGNGTITVEKAKGIVSARTSNGRIELTAPASVVDVESSNGAITITDAAGPVKAETSNGRITVSLTDTAQGPCDLETSNGSINLTVGAGFTGRLDASTSNGSIRYSGLSPVMQKITRNSGEFDFGPGAAAAGGTATAAAGTKSEAKTSNGTIEITRR
jgi:DUF4097 and DUF4098 domain-containing protein YvlB